MGREWRHSKERKISVLEGSGLSFYITYFLQKLEKTVIFDDHLDISIYLDDHQKSQFFQVFAKNMLCRNSNPTPLGPKFCVLSNDATLDPQK